MEEKKPKKFAILGNPVSHSLSPLLHNQIFQKLKIAAQYDAMQMNHLTHDDLSRLKSHNYLGFSITIPHKTKACQLAQKKDQSSQISQASNTLIWHDKEAAWYAFNTDGMGAIQALQECISVPYNKKRFVVIGYGGVSAGIITELLKYSPAEIIVTGRNYKKAQILANKIQAILKSYSPSGLQGGKKSESTIVHGIGLSDIEQKTQLEQTVLINCTPVGLLTTTESDYNSPYGLIPIDSEFIDQSFLVFDTVYRPMMTPLLQVAKDKGCQILPGYKMFLYQAVQQCEFFLQYHFPHISHPKNHYQIRQWMQDVLNDHFQKKN